MEQSFATRGVERVPLPFIDPHPLDPFKPYAEDKLAELAGSIADVGLLEPVCLRKSAGGRYEILAGKNRVAASRLIGETEIDALVYGADDETALLIITESNLKHRDRLLPSERGFAYKIQTEIFKKSGKRDDTAEESDWGRLGPKTRTGDKVAEHNRISATEVKRYIRLTFLTPELLELVDSGVISVSAGVDLSYISEQSQKTVYEFFYLDHIGSVDTAKSELIKKSYQKDNKSITPDNLEKMFLEKRDYADRNIITISRKKIAKLASELPDNETLELMFYEFLAEKFGAKGKFTIKHVKTTKI